MPANISLYKIFIGAGVSATIGILTFMGNGIIDNEVRNVTQHNEIRKEIYSGDMAVREKLDRVEDIVTEIKLDQRETQTMIKNIGKKL